MLELSLRLPSHNQKAYRRPTANTAETWIFRLVGKWSLKMEWIGRTSIDMSDRMFQAPEKKKIELTLRH